MDTSHTRPHTRGLVRALRLARLLEVEQSALASHVTPCRLSALFVVLFRFVPFSPSSTRLPCRRATASEERTVIVLVSLCANRILVLAKVQL